MKKVRVGIIGCGAIGSGVAKAVVKEFNKKCVLSALFDIDAQKAAALSKKLLRKNIAKSSIAGLIKSSDIIVEAVAYNRTKELIRSFLNAGKDVLVMSTGQILDGKNLFALARRRGCRLLLPSGAIAGLDALKAVKKDIKTITLTTRKPFKGLEEAIRKQGGNKKIPMTKTVVLFDGHVSEAIRLFPSNINVAATIALATESFSKLRIRIITSPEYKTNSHEIEAFGHFGHIHTKTENVACPDNPKTSYLAILSAIQALRQYVDVVQIGF